MQAIHYIVQGNTVIIESSKGFLGLTAYSNNIIRIRYAASQTFSTKESLMITASPDSSICMKLSETAETLIF